MSPFPPFHALSERDEKALWLAALQETRIQADFADMVTVQHPAKEALQAETVTTMRACSKSSLKNIFVSIVV